MHFGYAIIGILPRMLEVAMPANNSKDGNKLWQATAYEALLDFLTKTINTNPKNAFAHLERAKTHYHLGNFDQAAWDFNTAIRLNPDYAKHSFDLEAALSKSVNKFFGNSKPEYEILNKIPDAVLFNAVGNFLTPSEYNILTQTSKTQHKLFKPALAVQKILQLVVRYELRADKSKKKLLKNINPVLRELKLLLRQQPALALQRGYTIDYRGGRRYWSALEAAYWMGNWEICNIIMTSLQTGGFAAQAKDQLINWDTQSFNYNLYLLHAGTEASNSRQLPMIIKKDDQLLLREEVNGNQQQIEFSLRSVPTLIKQENTFYLWGNVNGAWQYTKLADNLADLLATLPFPTRGSTDFTLLNSEQISREIFTALKPAHTIAHFNLEEYIHSTQSFIEKYPADAAVPQTEWVNRESVSYQIGKAQQKFPAWLAAIWCMKIPFSPAPDFTALIHDPLGYRLTLTNNNHFFTANLGVTYSIFKDKQGLAVQGVPAGKNYAGSFAVQANHAVADDLAAMVALDKMMTNKLTDLMQQIPNDSELAQRITKD